MYTDIKQAQEDYGRDIVCDIFLYLLNAARQIIVIHGMPQVDTLGLCF
jgi:hypothetical protein